MKKIMVALLSITMLLSIASCGEKEKHDEKAESGKNESFTVSAYDVMDGNLGKYEVTIDGDKAVLTRSDVYKDGDYGCIFNTTMTVCFEKSGDNYTVTKVKRKQTISGDRAEEYIRSLDPEENIMILQMLSENGLEYTEEMMAQSGMTGMTASFAFDSVNCLTELILIDLYTKITCKFTYDHDGKQTGCHYEYKTNYGDEWAENYVFKDFYDNGQPKTVESDGDSEEHLVYIYNEQGYCD